MKFSFSRERGRCWARSVFSGRKDEVFSHIIKENIEDEKFFKAKYWENSSDHGFWGDCVRISRSRYFIPERFGDRSKKQSNNQTDAGAKPEACLIVSADSSKTEPTSTVIIVRFENNSQITIPMNVQHNAGNTEIAIGTVPFIDRKEISRILAHCPTTPKTPQTPNFSGPTALNP